MKKNVTAKTYPMKSYKVHASLSPSILHPLLHPPFFGLATDI